jgi:hypothetical protein
MGSEGESHPFNAIDLVAPGETETMYLAGVSDSVVSLVLVFEDDGGKRWRKYRPGNELENLPADATDL